MTIRCVPCWVSVTALLLLAAGDVGAQGKARARSKDDASSSTGAVHVGKLRPVNEPEAIASAARGFLTVPGTDVRFGYLTGPPEGWYEIRQGTLSWREPPTYETHHLGITLQDAADLRVIPDCKVYVSASDMNGGDLISTTPLTLMWGREFYYYGTNVAFPSGTTSCTLAVRAEPPGFARRSRDLGDFFTRPVTALWRNVKLESGQRSANARKKSPMTGDFGEGRHPAILPTPYPGSVKD